MVEKVLKDIVALEVYSFTGKLNAVASGNIQNILFGDIAHDAKVAQGAGDRWVKRVFNPDIKELVGDLFTSAVVVAAKQTLEQKLDTHKLPLLLC